MPDGTDISHTKGLHRVIGPTLGYFSNPSKTWLVVKKEHFPKATELSKGTGVQLKKRLKRYILKEGQRYLGSLIGTQRFQKKYISDKIIKWIAELEELSEIAKTEPQIEYCAYTFGLSKRCSFVMRTINNISDLLQPLEDCIRSKFIPVITNTYECNDLEREPFIVFLLRMVLSMLCGAIGVHQAASIMNSDINTIVQAFIWVRAARTQGCVFLRKNAGRVREIGINLGAQCAPRVFLILILVFLW